MFIQVIQGRSNDDAAMRNQWQLWDDQLKAGALGFLGATAGVTDDGAFIAMVRFESETAAARNSERPDQQKWWHETTALLDEVAVRDSTATDVWNKGGSDESTFVQIRQGTSSDPARLRDLYVNQQPVRMGPFRPEVLGGAFAWHGSSAFTLSAYFTSEQAARNGERLHEFASFFEDISAVMNDVAYYDLRMPWLLNPGRPCTLGVESARS